MKIFSLLLIFICSINAADKPNILFILTDDQRNDNLSCYGNKFIKTPVIDSLAEKGARFKNTFVTTAICAASRASILSGLFETTHGFTFGMKPLSEAAMSNSYPALLKANGYKTGFAGKWGVRLVNQKGMVPKMFDAYKPMMRPFMVKQKDGSKRHIDEIVGDEIINMIEQFKEGPFCISASFASTHADDGNHKPGAGHFPYPASAKDLYSDVTFPLPKHDTSEYLKTLPDFFTNPDTSMNRYRYYWRWDTKEKYQTNMQAYARMTTGIDSIVGRMLHKLKELGLDKNTVVIYTADNGFFMGNRGFAGKWSHFEESLRVPLIIHDPRIKEARVLDQMVLNLDLAATMLDIAGVKIPSHYQGGSLMPMVKGESVSYRDSYFCEHRMNNKRIPKWQGIRGKRYTYANYYEEKHEFLYDLEKDPEQLNNLAKNPEYESILKKMRSDTDARQKKYLSNPIRK